MEKDNLKDETANSTNTVLADSFKTLLREGWINVKKAMPTEDGYYLCATLKEESINHWYKDTPYILERKGGKWNVLVWDKIDNQVITPTHWMPMVMPSVGGF